jgi:PilZ domain
MVAAGKERPHTELRKKPRRQFHYTARIIIDDNATPVACSIADISDLGARLRLAGEIELPETFWLLLTAKGNARRRCRTIWRDGLIVGVAFPEEHGA